jgi:hypothetical protein
LIYRTAVFALVVLAATPVLAESQSWRTFASNRTTVTYANVDPAYAEAIAKICDTALAGYEGIYGLKMPERVRVRVSLDPKQRLALWTDGDISISLELSNEAQLLPPAVSGVFNVYGFCHELGHMAIYRRMSSLMGMPEGLGEGWAHYFGSAICGYVWEKLGEKAWPAPHNYYEWGGPGRFERQMQNVNASSSAEDQAAYLLYQIDKRYGRQALGKALEAALATRPRGAELVKLFRSELVKATGDEKAAGLFPESLLVSRTTFDGGAPDLDSLGNFRGMKVKSDETGLLLYYDGDTADGKQSIGGNGEVIQFRAPEGKWRLDAVWLYGSRYGTPEPPAEDFSIFVCDAAMNVIADIRRPYSLFERGPEKWVVMRFDPVEVPAGFHVCLYFNATQFKGIYVGKHTSTEARHSRVGLPYSRISKPIPDYDWMIRAHITPVEKVDLNATAAEWGRKLASSG